MVFGVLLTFMGIGAVCALLYNCMVYALPVAVGLWAGFALLHAGAGPVIAIVAGFLTGGFVFAAGVVGFHASRSVVVRYAIAALFVVPAAYVGYTGTLEISALAMSSHVWEHIIAAIGAAAIAGTAFARLTSQACPNDRQDVIKRRLMGARTFSP